jgi:tetratricopeptide (TPR) repeat protein
MPQDADLSAALDIAIGHHEAGRIDLAEAGYREVLAQDPDDADALNLLGLILQDQGHAGESIDLLTRALEIDPDFPEALTNLARVRRAAGQPDEAAELAARAVALDPDLPAAQLQLGWALLDLARYQEALDPLQRAAELAPGQIDAHISLGNVRGRLNDLTGAVSAFEDALAIDPDKIEALVNLGAVLANLDRLDDALACQRHAASLAPDMPVTHSAVGASLHRKGDIAGSVEAARRALALSPDFLEAHLLLGTNAISLGQFDAAETSFRRALVIAPDSAVALGGLTTIHRAGADTAERERLSTRMQDPAASSYERITAGFALGSALDREGRYDEAFAAFARANELARVQRVATGHKFDEQLLRRSVTWTRSTFTPSLFADTAGWGDPSERPVFVVGMPRSGTTLVEQIAASHPLVFGAGELKTIAEQLLTLDGGPSHISPRLWDRARVSRVTQAYLASLASKDASAVRVIDKLPDNVLLLGQIAVLFPNARVILCRRDLRDVCLSCYFQHFGDGTDWSFDLASCASRARGVEDVVDHWRDVLPLRVHTVEYENMISDLEGESRRLIAFLGLEWDPACLDFHKADRTVLTASHWQVRQPLYATSAGRWRNYQSHLGSLLAGLQGLLPGEHAVAAQPRYQAADAHALAALAHAQLAVHAPDKAADAARRSIEADASDVDGQILYGVSLIQLGRAEDAIAPLREATRLAPGRRDAWLNLGSALVQTKQPEAACIAWREALAIDPDNVEGMVAYAATLTELGQSHQALIVQQKAAVLRPEDIGIQVELALALLRVGDGEAAAAAAEHAVSLAPDAPECLLTLGECLASLGRFAEAVAVIEKAIERAPGFARAHAMLAGIGQTLNADTELPRLRTILADPSVANAVRAEAGFALAKTLDRAADYDGAFEACATANKLTFARYRERGSDLDPASFERDVSQLLAWFTPERLGGASDGGHPSEQPVFIVGLPRSGTSLVEQIAASHPGVFGRGETKSLFAAVDDLNSRVARQGRGHWLPSETHAAASALLAEMQAKAGSAARITEKLPANLLYLGYVAQLFPNARVILCRRDPRDIGLSCYFENFTGGMAWAFDLDTIAAHIRQSERLVVHWRHLLPLRMLEVQYEDLVADLEGQSRRLIDFLGLEWDPACLAFHTTKRPVTTASFWQVRQPLYSSSVGRWRKYRRHLGPLLDGLAGLVPAD